MKMKIKKKALELLCLPTAIRTNHLLKDVEGMVKHGCENPKEKQLEPRPKVKVWT